MVFQKQILEFLMQFIKDYSVDMKISKPNKKIILKK